MVLAERTRGGSPGYGATEVRITARCSLSQSTQCRLEVVAGGRVYLTDPIPDGGHIAVSWDPGRPRLLGPPPWMPALGSEWVTEPLIAIDGVSYNQTHLGDEKKISNIAAFVGPASSTSAPSTWAFGPGEHWSSVRDVSAPGDTWRRSYAVRVTDIRVYSYGMLDVASLSPDREATCEEAHKGIVSANLTAVAAGPYCLLCDAGAYPVAGAEPTALECRPFVPFGQACADSYECEGGALCYLGRCTTHTESDCVSECSEIGRQCALQDGSWRCAACKPGLLPAAGGVLDPGAWEYECDWQPFRDGGDECDADGECRSGWCVPQQLDTAITVNPGPTTSSSAKWDTCCSGAWERGYSCQSVTLASYAPSLVSTPMSGPKVCAYDAAKGPAVCQQLGVLQQSRTSTAPDGSQVTGVRCDDGPSGPCIQGLDRGYRVMSPQTCVGALQQAKQQIDCTCSSSCKYDAGAFAHYCGSKQDTTYAGDSPRRKAMHEADPAAFNLRRLKLAILGEDADYVQADYARLIGAGVGPLLIEYAAAPTSTKYVMDVHNGHFLPLKACADWGPLNDPHSAYHNGTNRSECQPLLRTTGQTCPAPGAEATQWQPWQFCRSLF